MDGSIIPSFAFLARQTGELPRPFCETFWVHPSPADRSVSCPIRGGADVGRHGPLVEIGLPDVTYERVSHERLVGEVRAVLADPKFKVPPSGAQQEPVTAWLASAETDDCLALRRREDGTGEVDWNFVWLLFHEFICFAPDRRRMNVAIIGFD